MKPPPLLADRPAGQGLVVAMVVPIVYGALTGWMLGVSEVVYLVLALSGILGGYLAGLEHDWPLEGVYRGALGGLLFGSSILVTNGLLDQEPEAHLPHPETLLIVITGGGWPDPRLARRALAGEAGGGGVGDAGIELSIRPGG